MEVESKPEEIETLDRRILRLKIEREGLKRESDEASQDRLGKIEGELANLEQQSAELTTRWQAEKDKIAGEAKLKEQLDAARLELEQAQRAGDLAKAGELSYGRIPALEKQLAEAPGATKGAMLREEVTADDIAGVVSRWTGIPVDRMLEGEREKLLQHGGGDRQARDRPGRCGARGLHRGPPRARRAAGSEPAARLVPVPRARPASARPS